jgi:hypothetical protein
MELHLGQALDRLRGEFEKIFSPETVGEVLQDSASRWKDAPVQAHVAVLAERFARERSRAGAQASGQVVNEVPEVLFVCVHNAGRSQMAAALLDHHAQGRVHVRSAGSTPADEIVVHHLGYREFRPRTSRKTLWGAMAGCGIQALAFLVTGNVLAPVVAHIVLHWQLTLRGNEMPPASEARAVSPALAGRG